MVRPVLNPGRLLEPVSDCWPRGMTVHDRTRLTGQLHSFRKTPLRRGFCLCDIWLRGMTVHDAFHQKKAAYRSTPLILQDPASAGFLFMYIWLRGMTVHDRTRLTGQLHSFCKTPLRRGFCLCDIWLRGMTVHDAFHQKKAAYRSTPLIPQDPASAGFLFM